MDVDDERVDAQLVVGSWIIGFTPAAAKDQAVDLDATEDEAALGAAVLDVQILTLVH